MHSHSLQADDAGIATRLEAIQAQLAAGGDTNPIRIDVTTDQGVVTLRGRVNKQEAREACRTRRSRRLRRPWRIAERPARETREPSETPGVQRVIDLVKVGDLR